MDESVTPAGHKALWREEGIMNEPCGMTSGSTVAEGIALGVGSLADVLTP